MITFVTLVDYLGIIIIIVFASITKGVYPLIAAIHYNNLKKGKSLDKPKKITVIQTFLNWTE